MTTTLIKNADWIIGWDAAGNRQAYLRNADLAFTGDSIVHVGPDFAGPPTLSSMARASCVMPGLVDIHSHPGHEPAYRGIREEHGVANMYMSGLYERSQAFDTSDPELQQACLEIALCELLKSGVTSLCDISGIYAGWIDVFAKSGMRGFLAPGFASARWKLENDHRLGFDWDEKRGKDGLQRALALHRRACQPSVRAAVRRRLTHADRELHGRAFARQPSRRRRSAASPSRFTSRRA